MIGWGTTMDPALQTMGRFSMLDGNLRKQMQILPRLVIATTASDRLISPLLAVDLIESNNVFLYMYYMLMSSAFITLFVGSSDFHIYWDVPGIEEDDLDITFGDRSITIRAERKELHKDATHDKKIVERKYGKVYWKTYK